MKRRRSLWDQATGDGLPLDYKEGLKIIGDLAEGIKKPNDNDEGSDDGTTKIDRIDSSRR